MKPHEPSPVSTWNRTRTNAVSRSPIALLAALVLTLTPPSSAARAAQFERIVSDPLGADSTFAAAWADFNRDGLLDVCTIDGQIGPDLHLDMDEDPLFGAVEQMDPIELVDAAFAGPGIPHHLLQFLIEGGRFARSVEGGVHGREAEPQEGIEIPIER